MVHTQIFQRSKGKDCASYYQSIEWTNTSQQTRDVEPMLFQCLASIADDGRTLPPWRQNTENESNKQVALTQCYVRDAPFDIWGGGGGQSFFTSGGKQAFFGDQPPTILFLCFVEEFFCHMLSLLYTLPFGVFSGQHISHQFRQQTFFFCPHFQQTFFSDFCGDKLFFSILF